MLITAAWTEATLKVLNGFFMSHATCFSPANCDYAMLSLALLWQSPPAVIKALSAFFKPCTSHMQNPKYGSCYFFVAAAGDRNFWDSISSLYMTTAWFIVLCDPGISPFLPKIPRLCGMTLYFFSIG